MTETFVEELQTGDCFSLDSCYYVVNIDYKKNGDRCCVSLINGNVRWIKGNQIVEKIQIYTMDKDNTIIPIKETKKDADYQIKNIS